MPDRLGPVPNLDQVADEVSGRLSRLFLKDAEGGRPIFGDSTRHRTDPAFRDHVLFHEYFDGDNGRGLGASHQTGWTGLIALLLAAASSSAEVGTEARNPADRKLLIAAE